MSIPVRSARLLAARILEKIEAERAYASFSLKAALADAHFSDPRDASLATTLVYGVLERKLTLDYNIALYLRQPIRKLHPAVLTAMRLGAYQILFADKIPVSAAVNESVALVKKQGQGYAAGLVNAVLRKLSANGLQLPAGEGDEALSVRYSCPAPLIERLCADYGREAALSFLAAANEPRPVFVRRNPLRCKEEDFLASLAGDGVKAEACTVPMAYRLRAPGDLTELAAFRAGWFHVQDLSSQLAVSVLGAAPGDTVVDCCAAPGGKSFTAAQQAGETGTVYACDLYEHKTRLIEAGAARLGLTRVFPVCADARDLPARFSDVDRVLCDVPCSGLGVIGRKPEIRYKPADAGELLPQLQYEILCAGASMVRPGGAVLYSTCTLSVRENEAVCERFLASHPAFAYASDEAYRAATSGAPCKTVFLTPEGGDGFFFAKLIRLK